MTIAICCDHGVYYTDGESVESVRSAVANDVPVRIWWVAPHGQRFVETAWIVPESVNMIRTESDDG